MTGTADTSNEQELTNAPAEKEPLISEVTPPPEEKSPLEILQQEYNELHDRYLRLAADFDNFRKRSTRDSELRVSSAIERFARDMLTVADNLDRAITSGGESHEGLIQIKKLLDQALERHQIRSFVSIGEKFDPVKHEAIAYIPSEYDEGIVCNEVCQGYYLKENVIRVAQVTVSKGTENKENQNGN